MGPQILGGPHVIDDIFRYDLRNQAALDGSKGRIAQPVLVAIGEPLVGDFVVSEFFRGPFFHVVQIVSKRFQEFHVRRVDVTSILQVEGAADGGHFAGKVVQQWKLQTPPK